MNYFEHHIGDYDSATAHLSILEDGVYSRLLRVYYRTEAPVPADLKQACRLVRAQSKPERDAVADVLREFFELRDDGWHNARCDEELERFHKATPAREAKHENERERQRRARERRQTLFEELRGHGVVAPFKATTGELEALLSQAKSHSVTRDESQGVTGGVTRDDTATHLPLPNTQYPEEGADAPSARGALALRVKAAGILPEPGFPDFQALVDSGAQWAEFEPHVARALDADRPFRYLIATVIGERKRAAQRGPLPPAPPARDDRKTRQLATAAALTGATPTAPEPETIDAESRIVAARRLG